MQWIYQIVRAISETIWKGISSAPQKTVATARGTPGSVARFLQRLRAGRSARASAARDEDSDARS